MSLNELFELPGAYVPDGSEVSQAEERAGMRSKAARGARGATVVGGDRAARTVFHGGVIAAGVLALTVGLSDVTVFGIAQADTCETIAGGGIPQTLRGGSVRPNVGETVETDPLKGAASPQTRLEDIYAAMEGSGKLERPADIDESARRVAEARERTLPPDEIKAWSKRIADDLSKFKD